MAAPIPREGLVIAPNANQTILEILEQLGYPASYQCREGYCGSCKLKVTAGDVRYVIQPMGWTDQGEILPCVCQPITAVTLSPEVAREWYGDEGV